MKIASMFKAVQRVFLLSEKPAVGTMQRGNVKPLHQPAKVIFMPKREMAITKK